MQFLCQRLRTIDSCPSHHQEAYFAPTLRQTWGIADLEPEKMAKRTFPILVQFMHQNNASILTHQFRAKLHAEDF
jgi:hypothetical protein